MHLQGKLLKLCVTIAFNFEMTASKLAFTRLLSLAAEHQSHGVCSHSPGTVCKSNT